MIQWMAAKGAWSVATGLFGKWWKLGAGVIIGGILVFPMAQCSGAQNARAKYEAATLEANAKAAARNTAANDRADSERTSDAKTVSAIEKELNHVNQDIPDAKPTLRRSRRGCVQLQLAGKDISGLPECAGLDAPR